MSVDPAKTDAPAQGGTARSGRRWPLVLLVCLALAGGLLLRDHLTFDTLAENRAALLAWRDAHYILTVIGFVLAYGTLVSCSLPGATVMTLTGGFLFGTFPGVLFNVTAATCGAAILFSAVRAGFGRGVARRMEASSGAVGRLKRGLDANQWEVLFLMRLVPAVPFFVANLIPALVGVPRHRFVIATGLGILPGALVYTSVGAGLGEVFDRGGAPDLGVIFRPQVLLPILGLAGLAALPIVVRALRRRR